LLRTDPPVAGKAEVRHAGAPSFCRSVRGKNIPAGGDRELAEVLTSTVPSNIFWRKTDIRYQF
jgi:hypothetical protein